MLYFTKKTPKYAKMLQYVQIFCLSQLFPPFTDCGRLFSRLFAGFLARRHSQLAQITPIFYLIFNQTVINAVIIADHLMAIYRS